jgi:hypothetical protein
MCNVYVRLGLNYGIKLHKQITPLTIFSQNVSFSEGYIVYEVIFSTNPIASGCFV